MNKIIILIIFSCFIIDNVWSLNKKGYTWVRKVTNSTLNIVAFGTDTISDAYKGDTNCTIKLPILCYSDTNFKRPPYNPPSTGGFYYGWNGGIYLATLPVLGTSLLSVANMNSLCSVRFGASFKAAEHHIGKFVSGMSSSSYFYNTWPTSLSSGGWNAFGYNGISNPTGRFWVAINNQPANCWN
jgi:hypothetical protein